MVGEIACLTTKLNGQHYRFMTATFRNLILGYVAALVELYLALTAFNYDIFVKFETVSDYLLEYIWLLFALTVEFFRENLTAFFAGHVFPLISMFGLAALTCKNKRDFDFALLVPVIILPLYVVWIFTILFGKASRPHIMFSGYSEKPWWLIGDLWDAMNIIVICSLVPIVFMHRVIFSRWIRIKGGMDS